MSETVMLEDVTAARRRIEGYMGPSPCQRSWRFSLQGAQALARDAHVYLKYENYLRTGSFKQRGAFNKIIRLCEEHGEEEVQKRGIVAASAGNHGLGVACAAMERHIPAQVIMPVRTPLNKQRGIRMFGATVVLQGDRYDHAYVVAQKLATEKGHILVHAFDDPDVIAGQGTIGLEILNQVDPVTTIVAPVGGGGLIAGIAAALQQRRTRVRLVGVQSCAHPVMAQRWSEHTGRDVIIPDVQKRTIAEGIAVKRPGKLTSPVILDRVDEFVVVDDDEITLAIATLLESEKTLTEGAGAAALAAVLSGRMTFQDHEHVVVVLSGGNIDVNMLPRIVERGLLGSKRLIRFNVPITDEPGALGKLTSTIGRCGASVQEVVHERTFAELATDETQLIVTVETLGEAETDHLVVTLEKAGYTISLHPLSSRKPPS